MISTNQTPDTPTPTTPALRYHGGKWRMAPWILEHFPAHRCYVEPFGGAAGVLLQKDRCYAEVYNDLDGDVVNFFRVLRDPEQCARLITMLALTPYARTEFEQAYEPCTEPVERARRLAVRAQMGFGSAGATKGITGFRIDTKRESHTAQHHWGMYPDTLAIVGQRLAGVLIENRRAIQVMQAHDAPSTLHFVDPPYVAETRQANGAYRHEMTAIDHAELLDYLGTVQGMVVLCGYDNPLYKRYLTGWHTYSTKARAAGQHGSVERTETIWLNPACQQALRATNMQLELIE
jgi:DNA adenine methylase